MKRGLTLALALFAIGAPARLAWAQFPPPAQCGQFTAMSEDTHAKLASVQAAMKAKADRKQVCALLQAFVASEAKVIKFLVDNKTACQVPEQAISSSQANHVKSAKFRDVACSEDAPRPRAPSLSDAIKTPTVDSATNTKTGHGTFDTLTGNPLSR
jgi:hypothetical protein